MSKELIQQFQQARKDKKLVVLEGFHALKHAVRFKAEIITAISPNKTKITRLANSLAQDCRKELGGLIREVHRDTYEQLAPFPPRTGVISIAKRPKINKKQLFNTPGKLVWLDDPRDLENVGAVIRVSAGADAVGVVITGELDPWSPAAVRGAAGLQFALPVLKVDVDPKEAERPIVVYDLAGDDMRKVKVPDNATLVFGSERHGVSKVIKKNADITVRIPMKKGVSSLNLATSVAIGLFNQN